MKKRILSGVQPSGQLHIGNYFGMIERMIQFQNETDLLCFVANYHSMTSINDKVKLEENTREAFIDLLALGIDPDKSIFWVQSHVPEVTELAWILSNFASVGLMQRSTSYKDKIANGLKPNMGLFSYPILMASDILLFQSEIVPVGKDQKQHLEMTRDIASSFNHQNGETFVLPEPLIDERVMVIPGTDGRKMSKSYDNYINIFLPDKKLRKVIMRIETDSTPMEEPKNPDSCNVFALYKLLANDDQIAEMRKNYEGGNYGYGHAKQALYELIVDIFKSERENYWRLMENTDEIDRLLKEGAEKARKVAQPVLQKVRNKLGYN